VAAQPFDVESKIWVEMTAGLLVADDHEEEGS
jgi:hypothetical protein